ncbi:MAG: M15 family metallopeptidase [Christensenellales bacterium]
MKKLSLLILAVLLLFAACGPSQVSNTGQTPAVSPDASPTVTAPVTPSPTQTAEPVPTPAPTPTPYVKLSDPTSALTVRKGPGTNTDKLGTLRDGDPVTVLEQGDVWHKISYNGGEAYVFAAYIKNVPVYYAYVPALTATIKNKTYISDMVDVRAVVPDIKIWLTFASQDNVLGEVLYPAGACLLQKGTAEKLKAANELFKKDGYRIRLYDGYRPYSVSAYLFSKVRDGRFVANPKSKPSNHNRGAAVDITLERIDTGEQIPMPSFMHTFNISSLRSLPDIRQYEKDSAEYSAILAEYPDILSYPKRSNTAIRNMNYMTKIMKKCGFSTITTEWWHFADSDKAQFMVLDYDLKQDVQWIPEAEYAAFMAQKAQEEPLTTLPDYVIFPKPDTVEIIDEA